MQLILQFPQIIAKESFARAYFASQFLAQPKK